MAKYRGYVLRLSRISEKHGIRVEEDLDPVYEQELHSSFGEEHLRRILDSAIDHIDWCIVSTANAVRSEYE